MGKVLKEIISEEDAKLVAEDICSGIKAIDKASRPNRVYLFGMPQASLVKVAVELRIAVDRFHRNHRREYCEIKFFTGEAENGGYGVDIGSLLATYEFKK